MSHYTAYTGLDSVTEPTPGTPRGPNYDAEPPPCTTCPRFSECKASGHECDAFKSYLAGDHWQRGPRKSRARPGGRKQKIPQEIIDDIRRRARAGETGQALAREYRCNPSYVRRIIRGVVRA